MIAAEDENIALREQGGEFFSDFSAEKHLFRGLHFKNHL
jgi:hypothetical protein